jgi:hypothetical protein
MGFAIYKVEEKEPGRVLLQEGRPVLFSGPRGLVAQWVKAHQELAARPWHADADAWLVLLGMLGELGRRWIVFEQKDDAGQLRCARLLGVSGVCTGSRTELAFNLEPYLCLAEGPGLVLRREASRRVWSEELALEGTPWGTKDPWHWCQPKMALGSATLG